MKKNTHKKKGASPLLPTELIAIRKHWLAQEDIHAFGNWVFTILAICLAMRESEAAGLKDGIDNFEKDGQCFVSDVSSISANGVITSIGIKFKGKSDDEEVMLLFHTNWDIPDLMAWIYLTRFKKGYLFPSREELAESIKVCYVC